MAVVEVADLPDLMLLHKQATEAWRELERACDALSFLPASVALRDPHAMMTGPELAYVYANRARRRLARALNKVDDKGGTHGEADQGELSAEAEPGEAQGSRRSDAADHDPSSPANDSGPDQEGEADEPHRQRGGARDLGDGDEDAVISDPEDDGYPPDKDPWEDFDEGD